jgi:hypothetical protein
MGSTADLEKPTPLAPRPPAIPTLATLARQRTLDDATLTRTRLEVHQRKRESHRAPRDGFDPLKLAQVGWGIVTAAGAAPEVREALEPLVAWRKAQATKTEARRFAELEYRPGDSAVSFLTEYEADLDAADPADMPYYLLLVGSPKEISFEFQYQLDIEYAVGRLDFERVEDYAQYAEAVVAREKAAATRARERPWKFGVFAPRSDDITTRIHDELVLPLLKRFEARPVRGWQRSAALGEDASVGWISEDLKSADFLFTGCHGWGLPADDPQQRECMGALLDHELQALSAADLDPDLALDGLVAFFFTCASGGTPRFDDFEDLDIGPKPLAKEAFTARLPQQLLLQGAGAVLAHVGRAWTYSFTGQGGRTQINAFEDTLRRILRGCPVGFAAEIFNHRHVRLAADLVLVRELEQRNGLGSDRELADLFCGMRDARNFVVLGDPAVRLAVPASGGRRG